MTRLIDWLAQACTTLELEIVFGFSLVLLNGEEVRAVAHIADVGAPKGMLVFGDYGDVRPFVETLTKAGYGYSVLSEPGSDEEFDLDSCKEMIVDWGWSGSRERRPSWWPLE